MKSRSIVTLLLATCLALASAQDDKALKALKAYCSSPAFKKQSCTWADDRELDLYGSCIDCGTLWWGPLDTAKLPTALTQGRSYFQLIGKIPSLACRGPATVRTVFKQLRKDADQPGCTDTRLTSEDLPGAAPVVRCELLLPGGPGSEAQRALRSKEVNCRVCTSCASGGGCPNVPGKWYSDSFTITLPGCSAPDKDLASIWQRRAAVVMNPGTNILLAKYEICQEAGCYGNQLTGAGKCVKGKC